MSNRALVIVLMLLFCRPVLAMDLMDLYREAKANDARYAAAKAQFRGRAAPNELRKCGTSGSSSTALSMWWSASS